MAIVKHAVKDRYKKRKALMFVILCCILIGTVGIFLCVGNRTNTIESELIYIGDFSNETFVQLLISTEKDWYRYAERYGYELCFMLHPFITFKASSLS